MTRPIWRWTHRANDLVKRKEGNGAEAALTSGESVSKGVLTVNANKLAAATSGMLTYLCYISYYDSETKNTVNISADITYTLIRNAQNAKLAICLRTPTCLSMIPIPLWLGPSRLP